MTLNEFAALSVVLTGYPLSTILPQLDTQHQAQELLTFLQAHVTAEQLQQLTTQWQAIAANADPAQGVKDQIFTDTTLARIAQNIIMMWYLGVWYELDTPLSADSFVQQVISSQTYQNGLVWGTVGAHPMGYSEGNFGYWETPPALNPVQA